MSILRGLAIPIGALAGILLFLLVNPWLELEDGTLRQIVTVGFWATFIVLLVALFEDRKNPESEEVEIEGPAFTRFLFTNSRAGLFWLPIRMAIWFRDSARDGKWAMKENRLCSRCATIFASRMAIRLPPGTSRRHLKKPFVMLLKSYRLPCQPSTAFRNTPSEVQVTWRGW